MKLLDIPKGRTVKILYFQGGKRLESKLRQLGINPGREVKVLRYAPMGGPVMLDVEGRSVALGRGIAARVIVEKA